MRRMKFTGVGAYVPERVVTNHDLEKMMDTSDEWIQQRTGIVERRWVEPGLENSDMAAKATLAACQDAGCDVKDIDLIIYATLSPEYLFPGTGVVLEKKLGLTRTPVLDIRNQCSGFLYGLAVANGMIASGMYQRILLVGSELHSRGLNKSTAGRDVTVIFGDGAGATVLEATDEDKGLIDILIHADGRYAEDLTCLLPSARVEGFITPEQVARGEHYPHMAGNKVFKHAIVKMPEAIQEVCKRNHLTPRDLDVLIPHQANLRINEIVGRALEIEPKVFNNIQKYGNTTAASIPLAMRDALDQGFLKPGHLLGLTAFGSGFTWGAALVRM
ncbi:MAG: ketoacyl-ACP synthase III [Deltaproteobacteria bacterium]|nr:ketoacyl-ACP synthase III [Deltaproteobacteria bacterium]